jgi:hypothetical protein
VTRPIAHFLIKIIAADCECVRGCLNLLPSLQAHMNIGVSNIQSSVRKRHEHRRHMNFLRARTRRNYARPSRPIGSDQCVVHQFYNMHLMLYMGERALGAHLSLSAEETPKSLNSKHAPCDTYTLVAPQIWFGVDTRKIRL